MSAAIKAAQDQAWAEFAQRCGLGSVSSRVRAVAKIAFAAGYVEGALMATKNAERLMEEGLDRDL